MIIRKGVQPALKASPLISYSKQPGEELLFRLFLKMKSLSRMTYFFFLASTSTGSLSFLRLRMR